MRRATTRVRREDAHEAPGEGSSDARPGASPAGEVGLSCFPMRNPLSSALALLTLIGCIRVGRKAYKGRTAFLRWQPFVEALYRGERVYWREPDDETRRVSDEYEGFPNLPLMGILLTPFYWLGNVGGSVVFALTKCLVMAGVVYATVTVAESASAAPGAAVEGGERLLELIQVRGCARIAFGRLHHRLGGLQKRHFLGLGRQRWGRRLGRLGEHVAGAIVDHLVDAGFEIPGQRRAQLIPPGHGTSSGKPG